MAHRRGWTLAVVCVATAMLLLDVTVVNVALPAIERDLHADFASLQWVIDAYALTLAAALLSCGALADRLGRRRVFAAGLVLFTAASAACALAGTPAVLDGARAVQGLGAAAMFASSLALLAQEFRGRDRGFALGIWGATTGAALAIGPLVGGAVVDGLGWQWIFVINLPVGVVLVAATLGRLAESHDPVARPIDWPGVVTFALAAFLLVFALIRGNVDGWGSAPIVAALAAGSAFAIAFLVIEARLPDPMLDLGLFRIHAFSGTALVAFAQSLALYPMLLFIALYFEDVLSLTPFQTGLRMLPVTLALFAVAPLSGRLTARVRLGTLLAVGLALIGAGLLLMRGVRTDSRWTDLLPGFVVGGLGIGFISPALAAAMVGVVSPERMGLASGINNTFRQLGIATGIAALGAIFQHRIATTVSSALDAPSAHVGRLAAQGRIHEAAATAGHGLARQVAEAARRGFVAGFNEILLVAAVVALVAVPAALVLVRQADLEGAVTAA